MCGLCGWIAPRGLPVRELVAMNVAAAHRGPDGEGYWCHRGDATTGSYTHTSSGLSADATVALGHRRLAILDLSQAGAQPMATPDRRQWMVLNGEIYNYIELRNELKECRPPVHHLDRYRSGARGICRVGDRAASNGSTGCGAWPSSTCVGAS